MTDDDLCYDGVPCDVGTIEHCDVRFTLIGLIGSADFQQCLIIIELLHKRRPRSFPKPFIRPMLEFDWVEYKTKAQRKYGGKLWRAETSFIVFANELQLATCEEFVRFITQWLILPRLDYDYESLALQGISEMYEKYMELGRKFVYFSISVNKRYVGTLVIMLYHDFLPETCSNFLQKCNSKARGYVGTWIHRIMRNSWIQLADFTLPTASMPNENYVVPHNRRGILSMCSNGPHNANTTQFFITLNNAPWMDYRYVAFGQVMQGDYILSHLENLELLYQTPVDEVVITHCGELNMEHTAMASNIPKVEEYLENRRRLGTTDVVDVRDVPSILLEENYRALKYCYIGDDRQYSLANVTSSVLRGPGGYSYSSIVPSDDDDEREFCSDWTSGTESVLEQAKEFSNISELNYLHSSPPSAVETSTSASGSTSVKQVASPQKARSSATRKSKDSIKSVSGEGQGYVYNVSEDKVSQPQEKSSASSSHNSMA